MSPESSQVLIILIIGLATLLVLAIGIVVFLFAFQRRKLAHLQEKKEMESAYQEELLQASLEIQEATQTRVGQELHDNISPTLAVVGLHLSGLGEDLSGEPQQRVQQLDEWLRKAMEDVRTLSHSLNVGQVRNQGISAALKELAHQIESSGQISCTFSETGQPVRINGNQTVILFRMCQELVNNSLRHSGGHEISIHLEWSPENLRIEVGDNGNGNIPAQDQHGQGLLNIASRARVIGAEFELEGVPAEGTKGIILLSH